MSSPLSRWLINTLPFGVLLWLAGPGGFETTKLALLSICLLGALAIIARQPLNWRRPKLSLLIFVWLLYLSARAVTAPGPATAWLGTMTNPLGVIGWWVIGLLTIILINHNWTESDEKGLRRSLVWASWLVIGSVALQHWNSFGINWTTFDDPTRGRTLFGSIGSPAQLGVVTALLFSLLLDQTKRAPLTMIALAALTIASGSTTGVGLLAIASAITLVPNRLKMLTRRIISTSLFAAILLISLGQINVSRWPSLADRAAIWQSGLAATTAKPWWGWGPNHFSLAYDYNYPISQVNARSLTEERAHNLPLEVLVETGLVGLLILATALYLIGRDGQPTAWLWLVGSMFNPVITPIALLGLLSLVKARPKPTGQLPRSITVATGLFALVITYICVGLVINTVAADRANRYSSQYEFAAAANTASRLADRWPLHPQIALLIAEAQTNTALKTGAWIESDSVIHYLDYSRRQAVGFLPDRTRAHLADSWIKAGHNNATFTQIQNNWLSWSSHPRFQQDQY